MSRRISAIAASIATHFVFAGSIVAAAPQTTTHTSLFKTEPAIRANPIQRAPLVAIIDFESSTSVNTTLEISDGDREWTRSFPAEQGTKYSLPVLGMRPNRLHTIRVRVQSKDEESVSEPLSFHTPPLPRDFPPLRTTVSKPEKMEPGVTFFPINIWRSSKSVLDYGYIIAIDEEGEVVWYCHTRDRIADMRVTQAGTIIYQHGNYRYAYEIDLMGRDLRRWVATNLTFRPDNTSIPVEVDTMHHDFLEMDSGNFMTLATELRHFREYPTSEFTPEAPWAPAYVVCDRVIEFNPTNGEIVNQLHLKNILDNRRFAYMSLGGFWKDKYNYLIGDEKCRDWSHANALVHLPEENAIIVSFRHLDCVIKIDWETKKIKWILGNHGGWGKRWQQYLLKPVGNVEWTFHQHSPQVTPRGTLMMYDNGNYRARPFDKATMAPNNQSRVVEYKIDEDAMTVEQVFEYRGTEKDRFYCPFYCEADWMPETQNILVTDGGHIELADGTPDDNVPGKKQWARIFEITRGAEPEKVFEVVCKSRPGVDFGWSIYRSIRRPNLYDGFQLDAPTEDELGNLFLRRPHRKRMNALNAQF